VKKPLGTYELSQTELEIFRELTKSPASISDLANRTRKSQPRVTKAIQRLQAIGLAKSERTGMRKIASISDTKHAYLLKDIMLTHPHIPWELLLKYSQVFPFLESQLEKPATVSKTTQWRALRNLMAHGLVSRNEKGVLAISERFERLADFYREFSRFINSKLAESFSDAAVIVWSSDAQFIIRIPARTRIHDKRFKLTGTSALPRYGIPLISEVDYYYFSPFAKHLRVEDVLLHVVLTNGVTNVTYGLILMAKVKIDQDYLLKTAERFGLRSQVYGMLRFLATRSSQPGVILPNWDEFAHKAEDYGVKV